MTQPLALIIEDNQELGEIFAELLEFEGWQTKIIQEGHTALKFLAVEVPDVVMLDMHLPFVSGLDILAQIRRDTRLANTKVMLVTADTELAKFAESQADMVLVKPVGGEQLIRLSQRLLQERL